MTQYPFQVGPELFALRPSTRHNPLEGIVCPICEPKKMFCFVNHKRLVDIGLKVHRLLDSESVCCVAIVVHAEGAIQNGQLLKPCVVKKIEITEMLVCIYDPH